MSGRVLGPVVASLLVVSGCGPSAPGEASGRNASAITNPSDDADRADLNVVALFVGAGVTCSGALVGPRVVLTAAHCLLDAPPDSIFVGTDPATADGIRATVASIEAHPGYDPRTHDDDLGIVVLDAPVPATPAALPLGPVGELVAGASVRVVGFGLTGPMGQGGARKRAGRAVVGALGQAEVELAPGPSQPCYGDSGGPAFLAVGDQEPIVGVTSVGDLGCDVRARDTRVDAFLDFVRPRVEAYAPPHASGASCSSAPAGSSEGGLWVSAVALYALALCFRRNEKASPQGE